MCSFLVRIQKKKKIKARCEGRNNLGRISYLYIFLILSPSFQLLCLQNQKLQVLGEPFCCVYEACSCLPACAFPVPLVPQPCPIPLHFAMDGLFPVFPFLLYPWPLSMLPCARPQSWPWLRCCHRRVYGNIDFTVCVLCKKSIFQQIEQSVRWCNGAQPANVTCRGPHSEIEVSRKMEMCFLVLLSVSHSVQVFMFSCLTYSGHRVALKSHPAECHAFHATCIKTCLRWTAHIQSIGSPLSPFPVVCPLNNSCEEK